MYKIVIYTPIAHADKIRQTLRESGAGRMGDYEACSFSCRGIGRFCALEGAAPFLGKIGKVEEVEEERIETICEEKILDQVLEKIREVHPYEEPAIDVYPLIYPK